MVNIDQIKHEVRAIMSNPEYIVFAKKFLSETPYWLSTEVYDAEIDYTAGLIDAAKIEISELKKIIAGKDCCFNDFCLFYMKALPSINQGQEYNPAEPEFDDDEADEDYSGHSQTFVIQYVVIYFVLSQRSSELLPYLKKIRAPNAARQAVILEKLFSDFSVTRK